MLRSYAPRSSPSHLCADCRGPRRRTQESLVSVDIEREARNVNWNDLGHVIYSMVIQPEHNVNNGHTRRTVSRAFRTTCV